MAYPADPRAVAQPGDSPDGAVDARGAAAVAGERLTHRLYFYGTGADLFSIQIVNILLTLLTLGPFYSWGKARGLRFVLSQTELDGDRFAYHGTGRELLVGFLKAAVLFAVPFGLMNVSRVDPSFGLQVEAGILGYLLIYVVLVPIALVGARRYRLSRTSWRGIRFSFRASARELVLLFARDSLLSLLTAGLYYPWFVIRRHAFLVSHAYFGTEPFRFDGRGLDLFWIYARLGLLGLPTLGLYWFWFQAWRQRYLWEHSAIGGARFESSVTGRRLLRLRLGNALVLVGTLGLAWPWTRVRNLRFAFLNLRLRGALDTAAIRQDARTAAASGEGLAGLIGSGFELGS